MTRPPVLDVPVTLVTGGARGIGRGIARHLAALGHRVVIADVLKGDGEATARELASRAPTDVAGGDVRFVHADVSTEEGVRDAVEAAVEAFGGVSGLVCNAGIADPEMRTLEDASLAAWDRMLAVGLTGAFLCARAAAPHLRAARGAIVTIASTRAHQSEADTFAYAAAKGGLVALTHALAVSLGPDVRANVVSPGWIDVRGERPNVPEPAPLDRRDHAQHPAGRVGTADDVAEMVALLLDGARSGFVTGAEFVVDGGMSRRMIYV